MNYSPAQIVDRLLAESDEIENEPPFDLDDIKDLGRAITPERYLMNRGWMRLNKYIHHSPIFVKKWVKVLPTRSRRQFTYSVQVGFSGNDATDRTVWFSCSRQHKIAFTLRTTMSKFNAAVAGVESVMDTSSAEWEMLHKINTLRVSLPFLPVA